MNLEFEKIKNYPLNENKEIGKVNADLMKSGRNE